MGFNTSSASSGGIGILLREFHPSDGYQVVAALGWVKLSEENSDASGTSGACVEANVNTDGMKVAEVAIDEEEDAEPEDDSFEDNDLQGEDDGWADTGIDAV